MIILTRLSSFSLKMEYLFNKLKFKKLNFENKTFLDGEWTNVSFLFHTLHHMTIIAGYFSEKIWITLKVVMKSLDDMKVLQNPVIYTNCKSACSERVK